MLTVFAPGRVELLGNHTDYNEGLVLAFAVDRGVTLTGETRTDTTIHLEARDLGESFTTTTDSLAPEKQATWANYVLGVVAQFQERGFHVPGFRATIESTLPMGAGLSSSAALETATALFLQTILGSELSPLELAKIGQAAEHTYVGVKCGLLDQMTSIYSRDQHATFIDCRTLEVRWIPLPSEARFLVANSNVKHALVTGEYNERRASCETAARQLNLRSLRDATMESLSSQAYRLESLPLKRAQHIVGENNRVTLAAEYLLAGHLEKLGELMFASHESSRTNFENSCPELDQLVTAAQQTPGCLGARLSGGGFGGATINLLREGSEARVQAALERAYPAVSCLLTKASSGARIVS
jgi:galactokinase